MRWSDWNHQNYLNRKIRSIHRADCQSRWGYFCAEMTHPVSMQHSTKKSYKAPWYGNFISKGKQADRRGRLQQWLRFFFRELDSLTPVWCTSAMVGCLVAFIWYCWIFQAAWKYQMRMTLPLWKKSNDKRFLAAHKENYDDASSYTRSIPP